MRLSAYSPVVQQRSGVMLTYTGNPGGSRLSSLQQAGVGSVQFGMSPRGWLAFVAILLGTLSVSGCGQPQNMFNTPAQSTTAASGSSSGKKTNGATSPPPASASNSASSPFKGEQSSSPTALPNPTPVAQPTSVPTASTVDTSRAKTVSDKLVLEEAAGVEGLRPSLLAALLAGDLKARTDAKTMDAEHEGIRKLLDLPAGTAVDENDESVKALRAKLKALREEAIKLIANPDFQKALKKFDPDQHLLSLTANGYNVRFLMRTPREYPYGRSYTPEQHRNLVLWMDNYADTKKAYLDEK